MVTVMGSGFDRSDSGLRARGRALQTTSGTKGGFGGMGSRGGEC